MTESIVDALEQEDALCDAALRGLSDWLADESRVPLRHPLTACCSVILRHLDIEENIVFPRLLLRTPEHTDLITRLTQEHRTIRDLLVSVEELVISEKREKARAALADLRALLSKHSLLEQELVPAITECMTDPGEVGHLFHSGYFRGKIEPLKTG